METWQNIKARWEGEQDFETYDFFGQARKDVLDLCNAIAYQMAIEVNGGKVMALLQADDPEMILYNVSLDRRLMWNNGDWVVSKRSQIKPVYVGDDLATALKWLKGEE